MPVIEVSHLTKEYRLGALQSARQTLVNAGRRLIGRPVAKRPLFKALDDVSFSVEQGEVMGIIGHNGAGKSTLLKMLARISTPTSGSVKVNGRIAPLIEVGAGFIPDFTGRENVYLNGAILGMSRKEIDRKFDEIVDFAEIAEFIDTPVKRYSSGMQVKLAFAVATSIESEILIVDEVLAVGDLAFQRKCFDRMESMIKRQGKTVLLVSHNIRQVQRLCSRALLIHQGKVKSDGVTKTVCDEFFALNDDKIRHNIARTLNAGASQSSKSALAELLAITLLNRQGEVTDRFKTKDVLEVQVTLRVNALLVHPIFAFGVHTTDLLYLGTQRSADQITQDHLAPGLYKISCQFVNLPFLAGIYSVRMSIVAGDVQNEIFYGENLSHFQVVPEYNFPGIDMRGEGFVHLDAKWALEDGSPCLPTRSLQV